MEIELNSNLHPKYKLIGNDINIMKRSVSNITARELLRLIPEITINKNALFYHNGRLSDKDDVIGSIPKTKNDMVKYTFDIDLAENKKDVTHIYYNKSEIKVLDFTQIAATLGFNVLHFMIDGDLFNIEEKVLYDYCKRYNLDGYITLEAHRRYANCYTQINYINNTSVCPAVYLVNIKDHGIDHLILMGLIHLDRKKELTYDELLTLNNLLFCNLNNLFNVTISIKTEPIIDHNLYHTIHFIYNDKEYDLNAVYKNKGVLPILDLNYKNLDDVCAFQFYDTIVEEDYNNITDNKYDIVTDKKINTTVADKLINTIFEELSQTYDIDPFLMNNYTSIGEIEGYEQIVEYVENSPSIEDIKSMFTRLEKNIFDRVKIAYGKSDLDQNLYYLQSTYNYITRKVVDAIFKNSIEDVINILNGVDLKKYNFMKFFKVDLIIIDIGYHKYKTYKILYQGLLDDITVYKKTSSIDLELIKYLSTLIDNNIYGNLKKEVYGSIYDVYKQFLKDAVSFGDLYRFLHVDDIYNFIYYFANNNDIPLTLLIQYNDIIRLPMLKNYPKSYQNMNLDEFKEYLDRLSTHIITAKIVESVGDSLGVDIALNNVKKFIEYNVEKYLETQIDDPDSAFNTIKNDINFDYYNFIMNDLSINDVLGYIEDINKNDDMVDYIYKYLKLPIQNKDKIVRLLENKNLYNVFINHLQGDITNNELKKMVYFSFEEEKKNKRDKEKTTRRNSGERRSKRKLEEKEVIEEEEEEEEELTEEM